MDGNINSDAYGDTDANENAHAVAFTYRYPDEHSNGHTDSNPNDDAHRYSALQDLSATGRSGLGRTGVVAGLASRRVSRYNAGSLRWLQTVSRG